MPIRFPIATVLALVIAPGVAVAQEPGVHVDPGTPAQKEYAIPLAQARIDAATSAGRLSAVSRGTDPPLFGVGITPASRPGTVAGTAARGKGDRARAGGRGGTSTPPPNAEPPAASATGTEGAAFASPLGLGIAVLIVGLVVGVVSGVRGRPRRA